MKVKELIEILSKIDGDKEVKFYGYNNIDVGDEHIEIDNVGELPNYVLIW